MLRPRTELEQPHTPAFARRRMREQFSAEHAPQEKHMHYKNGREAKNGDKVVLVPSYGSPIIGILYDATAGNDHCNGRLAPTSPSDPCPNLKEVLHLDDFLKALPAEVPDTSKT